MERVVVHRSWPFVSSEKRRHLHTQTLNMLPEGKACLLVQLGADDRDEARARVDELVRALRGGGRYPTVKIFDDPAHEEQIMAVREGALGATARVPGMPDTWPGWEDSAVPPESTATRLSRQPASAVCR